MTPSQNTNPGNWMTENFFEFYRDLQKSCEDPSIKEELRSTSESSGLPVEDLAFLAGRGEGSFEGLVKNHPNLAMVDSKRHFQRRLYTVIHSGRGQGLEQKDVIGLMQWFMRDVDRMGYRKGFWEHDKSIPQFYFFMHEGYKPWMERIGEEGQQQYRDTLYGPRASKGLKAYGISKYLADGREIRNYVVGCIKRREELGLPVN
ncbi:MAG: hypothetical protein ACI8Y7_000890 [Candidatus Woesearchaeota archaeon]|jgi:hypothetical protein